MSPSPGGTPVQAGVASHAVYGRIYAPREPFLSPTSFSNQIWVRKLAMLGNVHWLRDLHRVSGLASGKKTCIGLGDLHRVRGPASG